MHGLNARAHTKSITRIINLAAHAARRFITVTARFPWSNKFHLVIYLHMDLMKSNTNKTTNK